MLEHGLPGDRQLCGRRRGRRLAKRRKGVEHLAPGRIGHRRGRRLAKRREGVEHLAPGRIGQRREHALNCHSSDFPHAA
ncbi:hypothetical protein [Allorhizocola rhizosphaerae]|uniref:hypothetical protein n=1 Tax=Allorhizocola rhizosphaerae TaxID=1872709 RepID=UPI0013C2F088